ncbi:MAG: putative Ig domain-containing protein, partial [Bryobacterales bacterium]|nr:putative Ig domain-containing protein [Bryobacterales bacterium]
VGLTLNSTTGVVSGTPTQSQVSAFSIKVADSAQTANQTASADCSISVAP